MSQTSPGYPFHLDDVEMHAMRAQGSGGQNVNKVSSAIHLKFAIHQSRLDDKLKQQLLAYKDARITEQGVVVIKAQRFRTQEKNKADALERLKQFIVKASFVPKQRRATKPSRAAKRKRLDQKNRRGQLKALRGKVQ